MRILFGLFLLLSIAPCLTAENRPIETERQWIVVTTADLREAVSPLVQRRKEQDWETRVLVVQPDAGNENSTRLSSPAARDLERQLAQLCANFSGMTSILIVGHWDLSGVNAPVGKAGRMKGVGTDHPFGIPGADGAATVAVGRLPAKSLKQVRTCVEKIIAFEDTPADQNQISLLVGDPGGRSIAERSIAKEVIKAAVTERLQQINKIWRVDCAMDIDGSHFSVAEGQFSSRVAKALTTGQQFAVYCGHSGPSGLSTRSGHVNVDEAMSEVQARGRTGVFLTTGCYSCQVTGLGGQGYGISLLDVAAGPAAVIGAYAESYAAPGQLALDGVLQCLSGDSPPRLLGEYWLAAQAGIARGKISLTEFYLYDMADGTEGKVSLNDQRREHLEMWGLFGDPAMVIPCAEIE